MRHVVRFITFAGMGMLCAMAPRARADEWNQKTVVTFNQPVEIPGRVLDPGTYVFKLADSMSDRNIVQVFNKNETHLYGTFLAIPDYHLRLHSKPVITFEERAAGAPEAVRAWFYPGDNYGHEFVYPKVRAAELANANHQPVAYMPQEMAANTTTQVKSMQEAPVMALKQAPLKAEKPNEEEVEITEAFTPPPVQTAARLPKRLPKTASPLPLIALLGFASLAAAGVLRRVSAH